MKTLLRPKVFIPLVLSASVIAGLLAFADVRKVLALLLGFRREYLLYFFLLMLAYEVVRLAQWRFLLHTLGVRVPFRTQVFSFLAGEVAKTLPIGNYFPGYLLSRSKGARLGTTSAATTIIILVEVAVSLVGVVILGIGDWGWLRPTILLGAFAAVLIGWALLRLYDDARPPRWMTEREGLRRALRGLRDFRAGAGELMRPRILGVQVAFGALYLGIAGVALYVVLAGLGVQGVTVWHALAVYLFSLAIGLIVPIPIDIGLIEIGGIGALLAFGVDRSDAVGAMLLNRALGIGASLLIGLLALLALRGELRAALAERTQQRRGHEESEGAARAGPDNQGARETAGAT